MTAKEVLFKAQISSQPPKLPNVFRETVTPPHPMSNSRRYGVWFCPSVLPFPFLSGSSQLRVLVLVVPSARNVLSRKMCRAYTPSVQSEFCSNATSAERPLRPPSQKQQSAPLLADLPSVSGHSQCTACACGIVRSVQFCVWLLLHSSVFLRLIRDAVESSAQCGRKQDLGSTGKIPLC